MRKVKKIFIWVVTFVMAFSLILWLFLFNLEHVAFNLDFYKNEYLKNDVPSVTKMEIGELLKVTEKMHEYLKGKADDMDVLANIGGDLVRVFNDKELAHMKDVKNLFKLGFWLKDISIAVFLAFFALLVWQTSFVKTLSLLQKGVGFSLLALLILGVLIVLDFENWFTLFHLAFFNNDLWLLDVEKDRLIQMFPLNFFEDAVYLIFKNTLIEILAITGGVFAISKLLKEPS
ncbi:MAG: Integral membrane protein TIGR01906 [Caldanaerobacter subterraneus]|uniref:TIGR01906 family membrane protein n=1 Tax=Caldanaerobacter subterraneus TaxID=911092 RepID=A0A117KVL2_9THEO|nr:TIGR01906 family membrane protein [Caldanaerobacter subterraneus]KUK08378.1 MAG: Integral membrane protein TIGR01906 [Caldanaerobacter subterraneus]HBT48546.1 TIGR01906 family membrane protein [Caldanaerobacter subterraneus]